jgi:hypothetical protein
MNSFSNESLISRTIKALKYQLTIRPNTIPIKMDILTADIGLTVGLEKKAIEFKHKSNFMEEPFLFKFRLRIR